jgi:hypothetical protein
MKAGRAPWCVKRGGPVPVQLEPARGNAQTFAGSFTSVRRMLLPEGSRKPQSIP